MKAMSISMVWGFNTKKMQRARFLRFLYNLMIERSGSGFERSTSYTPVDSGGKKRESLHSIAARDECVKREIARFPENKREKMSKELASRFKAYSNGNGVELKFLETGTILYLYLSEKGRTPERFEAQEDGTITPSINRVENIELGGDIFNAGKKLQSGDVISFGPDTTFYHVDQIIAFLPKLKLKN